MPGCIRKRGKASWTVVIDLGRDPLTGNRRQLSRSVKGAKRDAEALLVQLLHQRDSGIDTPPGRLAVADYLERWLATHARPNTAPTTFRRYQQIVRVHLVPALGQIPLGKLRPSHIQQMHAQVRDRGRSARTSLHCHRVLSEALRHAVRWQLLARNPADAVEAPRPERYEIPALGPEDVRRVLAAADDTPYGPLIHLAVTTGLRQGELLGLRWEDVDLDAGTLSVRQTCQWLPREGFVFRGPKTHRSTRPVALSPETVRRLQEHRRTELERRLAAGPAYQDLDLVFTNGLGAPIHPTNLRRVWLRVAEQAGQPGLRFHDLRHAHASLLLRQGVHPKIVQERLGHSTVGITLDIYSHITPTMQAQAARGFDEMLANG